MSQMAAPLRVLERRAIPSGERGVTGATLPRMAALIREARVLPMVRGIAARAASGCGPTDAACRVKRVYRWACAHMRFVPDTRGVELLHTAQALIATIRQAGVAPGDCDDYAILLASLLESVGTRTRLKAVSVEPPPVARLVHVFVEAHVPRVGGWVRLDPLGRQYRAEAFTRAVVQEV